jgi:hypothetical protein
MYIIPCNIKSTGPTQFYLFMGCIRNSSLCHGLSHSLLGGQQPSCSLVSGLVWIIGGPHWMLHPKCCVLKVQTNIGWVSHFKESESGSQIIHLKDLEHLYYQTDTMISSFGKTEVWCLDWCPKRWTTKPRGQLPIGIRCSTQMMALLK